MSKPVAEFTLVLPPQDVQNILKSLEEIPLKYSRGVYDRIVGQVQEQQKAAQADDIKPSSKEEIENGKL